ncbi:uncharacterized protein LOC116424060 isoform X2 [Nomia melanderi]|uniref:uncharacterized protein LOC116424060 isoform X2 n=1 Tax=Nomia melanderi TaxID=2448451 RepID=UPI003FCE0FD0
MCPEVEGSSRTKRPTNQRIHVRARIAARNFSSSSIGRGYEGHISGHFESDTRNRWTVFARGIPKTGSTRRTRVSILRIACSPASTRNRRAGARRTGSFFGGRKRSETKVLGINVLFARRT